MSVSIHSPTSHRLHYGEFQRQAWRIHLGPRQTLDLPQQQVLYDDQTQFPIRLPLLPLREIRRYRDRPGCEPIALLEDAGKHYLAR